MDNETNQAGTEASEAALAAASVAVEGDAAAQPDELTVLKQRARLMGIEFSNNIKIDTLRERIANKLILDEQAEDEAGAAAEAEAPVKTKQQIRQELLASQMKLVRLRIANMDPKKKDLPGEIFTVANEYIGTVRKFIPYGEATDDGYHVPFCLYQDLESRRFLNIRTVKDKRTGARRVETSWQKEFALEVLPDLTKEELTNLAQAQIAAGSVSGVNTEFLS